jgi:hypothetical protein
MDWVVEWWSLVLVAAAGVAGILIPLLPQRPTKIASQDHDLRSELADFFLRISSRSIRNS